MKTTIAQPALFALVVSALSVPAPAANNPAVQSARSDVSHLTLLTGPNLTSPPHHAAVPAPVQSAPESRVLFQPNGAGNVTLSNGDPHNTIVVPPNKQRLPKPDTLRFDSILHAPHSPTLVPSWKFTPAPQRD